MQMVGNLAWTENQIALYRQQIDASYHKDFFLALMSNHGAAQDRTEVKALMDEKSAIMSSFFSRLSHEFIEPVLEAVYEMERNRLRLPLLRTLGAAASLTSSARWSMLQKACADIQPDQSSSWQNSLAVAELNPHRVSTR